MFRFMISFEHCRCIALSAGISSVGDRNWTLDSNVNARNCEGKVLRTPDDYAVKWST